MGRTLRSRLNRRGLVSHRKTPKHQLIRNKGSFPGPAVFQSDLQEQSHAYCLRQHPCGVIHKQTGQNKICRALRSNVENSDLVQPQQCHTLSKTRTQVPQYDSRRPLQEESAVFVSADLQTNFQDMGESPSGPLCNQLEHKTSPVRFSDPGSSGLGHRCPEYPMGKPGCLRFSPNQPTAQGCTKTPVTNVQANTYHPRLWMCHDNFHRFESYSNNQ